MTPMERLTQLKLKYDIEEEQLLALAYREAFPELSYAESLRHAYAKLRKERDKK